MTDDGDLHKVPRQGTAKMVAALLLVPAVVFFAIWALVRLTSSPEIPSSEIIGRACDTADETTTFSGQLDPDSLTTRGFEAAEIRIEFKGFLVRAEGSQVVSVEDVNPETGLIDLEITEVITGPAICELASFLEN